MAINEDKIKLILKKKKREIDVSPKTLKWKTWCRYAWKYLCFLIILESLRICCTTFISTGCADSQAAGERQQKASAEDQVQSRCPKQSWKLFYIAPRCPTGICFPKSNSFWLPLGSKNNLGFGSLITCLDFCHTCHHLDSQKTNSFWANSPQLGSQWFN